MGDSINYRAVPVAPRVRQELNATLDGDRFAGKRWDLVNTLSSKNGGDKSQSMMM